MGFNPFKAAKKVVNKVAKPFRKVSQKLIPKEMRFALPYLAAATPFMLPAGGFGASGLFSSAAGRGFLSSLANVAGQAGVDPEGDDINLFSTLLAGGTGALSTPGMGENLRSGIERGIPYKDTMTDTVMRDSPGFFQGAENLGREGLATAADFLSGSKEGLSGLAANPENLVTKEGAKILGKVAAPIIVPGSGDVGKAGADIALRNYLATDAAEQAEIEETTTADEEERADFSMRFNREAGNSEEVVKETLRLNGLEDYYEPPVEAAANGGIMGRANFALGGLGGRLMGGLGTGARMINNTPQGLNKQMEAASRIMNNNLRSNSSQGLNSQMEAAASSSFGASTEKMRPGMIDAQAAFEPKQADEFIEAIRNPNTGGIDYKMAEMKLGTKLKGDETLSQLISMYLYSIRKDKLGMAAITAGYGGLGVGAMANNSYANGGITGLKEGGMLNFGGREMDLRTGGFVPIGRKERADDVPARLSKNEFVMTADAVRAAGGGSVNEGAKRMYEVMNNLEARA